MSLLPPLGNIASPADPYRLGSTCPTCLKNGFAHLITTVDYGIGTWSCVGYNVVHTHTMQTIPVVRVNTSIPATTPVGSLADWLPETGSREKTKPIKMAVNEFPHKCTRCGQDAYVGLNEIDHANVSYNRTCR